MSRSDRPIHLLALFIVVTVAVVAAMTAAAGDTHYREGTFVSAGLAKVTILTRDGMGETTMPCAELVQVMRNGRPANMRDLVRGDLVQLITSVQLGKEYVVQIIAVARVGEDLRWPPKSSTS